MTRANWTFTNEIEESRGARLLQISSFDEVIELFQDCTVMPMWWEPATNTNLNGCNRVSFKLSVPEETYDAFFNAPAGYRGQYAISQSAGEEANRKLLNSLRCKLLNAIESADENRLVISSLEGSQAKIWIDEQELECQAENPNPSIEYEFWKKHDPIGPGLMAPVGTTLEVKGAWVNTEGELVDNPDKSKRSYNIFSTGDSK